jgi:hypothetical protein
MARTKGAKNKCKVNRLYDLNALNSRDAVSIAISLLYVLRKDPQYTIVSELSYLLDENSFMKLIKYFGGETIRIPEFNEVNDMLKILLLYQYHTVNKNSWEESLKMSGFDPESDNNTQTRKQFKKLTSLLETINLSRRL